MIDLRLARFHKGLSLAGAATAIGISDSYLSLIERRRAIPAAPIAKRVAEFYGHDVADVWPATTPDREAA
jgi:transcriptional regulator with XRE-family HTH domain